MSNRSVSPEGLVRGIRRWDLVAFTINAVIGAGIFGLPAKAFALIGSYSLIAFFACAFVVLLIILCFAEVGSRFDETGGPYRYAREAFGPTVAFEVGWLSWLARLTAFAANCNLMVSYLAYFWPSATNPVPRVIVIVVVVLALAAINMIGVRQAAIAGDVFSLEHQPLRRENGPALDVAMPSEVAAAPRRERKEGPLAVDEKDRVRRLRDGVSELPL